MLNEVKWEEPQEKAYATLKKLIVSYPILHLQDWKNKFYLKTDESNIGLIAALMQNFEGKLFSISYINKKISVAERNYSTTEKECLVIIWAVKKFRNYLHGREFIIETDHNSLQYLDQVKFINPRLMPWSMILQSDSYIVKVIKGSENHAADYLSRT